MSTDDAIEPTAPNETHWQVSYDDVHPIRIRDPVAEALCVLEPGDPFVVTYTDAVTVAGHSCPTAAGAYRLTQLGLNALYPDVNPVRGDIEVLAGGPRDDSTYGVMSRIVSAITGAAEEDGFSGLAGGLGDRRNHLHFADLDTIEPTFYFRRRDTDDTVAVQYHVGEVPDAGPPIRHLPAIVDGDATAEQRAAFADAWHGRVESVLTHDALFTVDDANWPIDR